ncbi:MAG: lysyl-tRNA synthetase, class [Frankiaceae bacterium]|nr:lysyl-tRNA synthetase, class [Frankiaceae bacterium]
MGDQMARTEDEMAVGPAGPMLVGEVGTRPRTTGWRESLAGWIGRLVTVAAVWSLISIPLRSLGWPDAVDDIFGLLNLPAEPNLFVVVLLFVTAGALRRRLHVAVVTVVAFQVVVIGLQSILVVLVAQNWDSLAQKDIEVTHRGAILLAVSSVLGAVLAVALWLARSAFPARIDSKATPLSLGVLTAGLAISATATFVLTELFPRTLRGTGERLHWTFRAVLGLAYKHSGTGLNGHGGHRWVASLSGLLSALAVLAALAVFLRSSRAARFLPATDELAIRRLILESGERDSLAYFATRREKSAIFSPDGRAAVTFRIIASVSLASADPLGHPSAWPAAINAWMTHARAHGCYPAVLSASEDGAKAYVDAGLKAKAYGDEAIVDVDSFSLTGRTMRPVRQAVTRAARAGYTVQVRRYADVPPAEMEDLTRCAEQWRGNDTERGFSMALDRMGDAADRRCVMVTAHDRNGVVRALLSFVPWGARGLSLDVMRRDREAENGLIEFMLNGLMDAAAGFGLQQVSLNFAVFGSVFSSAERVGAGPLVRFNQAVLSAASRFWQIETLYRSNAKYLPRWVPRFLCYDSSLTLTRAVVAAAMAEGFLPAPRVTPPRAPHDLVPAPDGTPLPFAEAVAQQELDLLHPAAPPRRYSEQQRVRLAKIAVLQADGRTPYPVSVPRDRRISDVRDQCADAHLWPDVPLSLAGRVQAVRDLGGVIFAVIEEQGHEIQVMLTLAETPAPLRMLWRQSVDLGDIVSVTGCITRSRRGELSLLVSDWRMASKCLRPMPSRRSGLADPDARVRHRYLDMLVNPDSVAMLRHRSAMVHALRQRLISTEYLEIETPMLQALHGGAAARPFKTRSNAYRTELFLRIAPELYLKRLCVGGLTKVFELNRNFRNEGADSTHNPEFTSLEVYEAYGDYQSMRRLAQDLILAAACAVHGRPISMHRDPDGELHEFDLTAPWPVISVHDAVACAVGRPVTVSSTSDELTAICRDNGVHCGPSASAGEMVLALYESLVEKQTVAPTFYIDFPIDACPLTRPHRTDSRLAERWDLVASGFEIGTAYSELIDPVDQRERLTSQSLKAAAGDPEALQLDEDFLTALEYGMPPTGGLGLGVDRVLMLLTGAGIRDTIAFPFVRPVSP